MHHLRLPTWLAILAALVSAVDATALYHRIYHPALAPSAKFSLRGTVHEGAVVDASGLETDLATFAGFISQLDTAGKLDGALYQLALERKSDLLPEDWILSSVKACHLRAASSDYVLLHLASNGEPSALNYFVSPLPSNGICPSTTPAEARLIKSIAFANTTVYIQKPRLPPLPELRSPPPLTPEGQVITPEPEKSFLQKYWIYILALMAFLVLAPAPPEGEGGAGPGGSGQGGQ